MALERHPLRLISVPVLTRLFDRKILMTFWDWVTSGNKRTFSHLFPLIASSPSQSDAQEDTFCAAVDFRSRPFESIEIKWRCHPYTSHSTPALIQVPCKEIADRFVCENLTSFCRNFSFCRLQKKISGKISNLEKQTEQDKAKVKECAASILKRGFQEKLDWN